MGLILPALERAEQGKPGMVLLMGEAGVGKTRLAREALTKAASRGWRYMSGKCLHESLTPYMPIVEALREGKLDHLMEFSRPPRVEHVLFVCPDGRIYAKVSRSEGKLDTEIFAGMLMAVGAFVKDSLSGMMDTFSGGEGFNVMGYERFRIVVGSRPEGNLVLVLTGQETELLKDEMAETLDRLVRNYGMLFCGWDGTSKKMEPLNADLERFIKSGKYDGIDEVTEPENRHWRLLTNVTRGIARASKEAPLLLFLDDLQWSDPSSLGLLRYLFKRLRNERFTVLGTCRSEELGAENPLAAMKKELESDGRLVEVDLSAMQRDDVIKLVEEEVGESLGRGELGALIARDSGGNPFLARELVALLKEEGVLVKDGGEWRLTKKVEKIGVPRKVGATIVARLGGLSRDEREVLETGAIMGEYFRPRPVACVLGISPLQAHRALREIEKRYRLVVSVEEGNRFRFNQALVREVVYKEVPPAMRREYHQAAVDCLVKAGGSGIEHLTELAYHASVGMHPDAGAHLEAAADAAKRDFHNAEAVSFYRSALEFAREEKRFELHEKIGETEYHAGRLKEAMASLEKAKGATPDRDKKVMLAARLARIIEKLGKFEMAISVLDAEAPDATIKPLVASRWLATRAWIRYRLWELDGAREDGKRALAAFELHGGSGDDIADCLNTLGTIENYIGNLDDGEILYRKGLAAAEAGGATYQSTRIQFNIGLIVGSRGHFLEALELFEQVFAKAERTGNQFSGAISLAMIGNWKFYLGHPEEAYETLTIALKKIDDLGAVQWAGESLLWQALCLQEMERLEEAERVAREALLRSEGFSEGYPRVLAALANILINKGKSNEAMAMMERQMTALRQPNNRRFMRLALIALAHAYSAEGRRETADGAFREAFDGSCDSGEPWFDAQGIRWWGEALASWGEKEKAIEKLEAAKKRFTEMDAALELRKTEEALAKLRAP
jgi:tetratricopeptide (TPR) repeat protein